MGSKQHKCKSIYHVHTLTVPPGDDGDLNSFSSHLVIYECFIMIQKVSLHNTLWVPSHQAKLLGTVPKHDPLPLVPLWLVLTLLRAKVGLRMVKSSQSILYRKSTWWMAVIAQWKITQKTSMQLTLWVFRVILFRYSSLTISDLLII